MLNPLYSQLFGKHAGNTDVFLHLLSGDTVTFDAFVRRSAQMAHAIVSLGLVAGDRIAVQVEKSPEALMLYGACVQTGIILLPLNTAYTPSEVAYFVEDSGADVVVCDASSLSGLSDVAAENNAQLLTLNADGTGSLSEIARSQPEDILEVPRKIDDLAAFLYTSGTTGRSKGAMLTQRNLLSNAEALAEIWRFTEQDKLLHALPIFHTHGLFVATNIALLTGGSIVLFPKFDLDELFSWMPNATSMMGVPTFYTRMLSDRRLTADIVQNMRVFISGSAPLLESTHKQFEERTGHRILERYGMTETNMSTSNPYEGDRRAGTVGHPLPGVEVKITDPESGDLLKQGDVGMIEVRGPNVFAGYWKMPEKTAAELRGDGFFITGDIGRLDDEGYLQIIGRDKDLIISGGLNVYPKEIELVLDQQPEIHESAVIGVPHADFGEAVLGIVVVKPGVVLEVSKVISEVGTKLARFKCPKDLVVVDALPRNTMGKVQKNVMRQLYNDRFLQS